MVLIYILSRLTEEIPSASYTCSSASTIPQGCLKLTQVRKFKVKAGRVPISSFLELLGIQTADALCNSCSLTFDLPYMYLHNIQNEFHFRCAIGISRLADVSRFAFKKRERESRQIGLNKGKLYTF